MTHKLYWHKIEVADIEATQDDIRCVICVFGYSLMLLSTNADKHYELIMDFDDLQEIRGEWWEATPKPSVSTDEFVKQRLTVLKDKYSLGYSTD